MDKIYKNKALSFLIVFIFLAACGWLFRNSNAVPQAILLPPEQVAPASAGISIGKTENIREENWSGTVPAISGSDVLANLARKYINERINDFRKQADRDVPEMRKEFEPDSPPATYTIDINARLISGIMTDSVIIDMYTYTGGANGNSSYKVFTASSANGTLLSLSEIIQPNEQAAFTEFVKTSLKDWRPEGTTESVVFEEDVDALTFSSFSDWSLDESNLIIYFDKYAIGPGALGAVAFPLPLLKIERFLVQRR